MTEALTEAVMSTSGVSAASRRHPQLASSYRPGAKRHAPKGRPRAIAANPVTSMDWQRRGAWYGVDDQHAAGHLAEQGGVGKWTTRTECSTAPALLGKPDSDERAEPSLEGGPRTHPANPKARRATAGAGRAADASEELRPEYVAACAVV